MSGTVHTVVYMNGQEGYSTDEDVGKDQDIYLEVVTPMAAMDGESTDTSTAKVSL